jgi:hypothetical protein
VIETLKLRIDRSIGIASCGHKRKILEFFISFGFGPNHFDDICDFGVVSFKDFIAWTAKLFTTEVATIGAEEYRRHTGPSAFPLEAIKYFSVSDFFHDCI